MMIVRELPLEYVIGIIIASFFGIWLASIALKGNSGKQTQKKNVRKQTRSLTSTKENLPVSNKGQVTRTRSSMKPKTPKKVAPETPEVLTKRSKGREQIEKKGNAVKRTTRSSSKSVKATDSAPLIAETGKRRMRTTKKQ